jgi:hypothetical protein
MASSEKAGALKDAFVNAIANDLGEETMAKAGAMENAKLAGKLGMEVNSPVATTDVNIMTGNQKMTNDGIQDLILRGPQGAVVLDRIPPAAFPITTKGYGASAERSLLGTKDISDFRDMYYREMNNR